MAAERLGTYRPDGWMEWHDIFKELFLSAFSYEGLPAELNSRYMELALLENGKAAFFRDDEVGQFVVTKAVPAGTMNIYNEPNKIHCIGGGGGYYQKMMNNGKDAVLIYNNFSRSSPLPRLEAYARRIAEIENTIDINVNAQKTPYLVTANKQNIASLKAIMTQIGEFRPFVIRDESLGDDAIKVMNIIAPYVVDKLEEEKRKLYNECLSFLGIDNNSSEKSERLLVDEIMVSNGFAIANRNARLQMREQGIEKINAMFGLNITVQFNNPSFFNSPPQKEQPETGDENNG